MDYNVNFGYKGETFFGQKKIAPPGTNLQDTIDKEFLHQMDQLNELLDDPRALEKLENETLVCECFCVNVGDIRSVCAELGTVELELLRATFSMGSGCGSCIKKSDYWINRVL